MALFYFLKYTRPNWYFNLRPNISNISHWVDYRRLKPEERLFIDFDRTYSSPESSLLDAAYQAWNLGFILQDSKEALNLSGEVFNIEDNYHFTRRFFKTSWIFYILFFRIMTFKNPIKEVKAFLKCLKSKNISFHKSCFSRRDDHIRLSPLPDNLPKVTVVLPTLNRYSYLEKILYDLSLQTIQPLEIIIIDQNHEPNKDFYQQFPFLPLAILYHPVTGQWTARNKGIESSQGDYILLVDDDSRVGKDWIEQLYRCLFFFNAEVSVGRSIEPFQEIPDISSPDHCRYADHCDSGNSLYRREVFTKFGLFDLQYDCQRWGDLEYGLRLYLNGCKLISTPFADRIHLKAPVGGLRQMGVWDGFKNSDVFAVRPLPSIIYFFKTSFSSSHLWHYIFQNLPKSYSPKRSPNSKSYTITASFLFLITLPVILFNLRRSFRKAQQMYSKGPLIKKLSS